MFLYSFEKLDVWQKSRSLNAKIYLISKEFPKHEQYSLQSQIRRAVVSISSNIAEGTSRLSYKDKARFTSIAYGSLMEVLSQLLIALDLGYISNTDYTDTRPLIEEIGNKLNSLRKSQIANSNKQKTN